MTVKNELIRVLEENRGQAVSGQELALQLHVTRAAVWKAVKALQEEGYRIGSSKKGYFLEMDSDVLSEEGIRLFLSGKESSYPIQVAKSMESTNSYAKKLAVEGACHGTLVLAEGQTKGRGRHGRIFFSPEGSGLYMSLILRPEKTLPEFLKVTQAAAVAVVRAVREISGEEVQIKWVNDIYYKGRKAGGILTEAITDFESGCVDAVILGIGLNIRIREE